MDESNREQTELLRHIWNEMKALGTNLGGRIDALRVELKAEIASPREGGRLDDRTDPTGNIRKTRALIREMDVILRELDSEACAIDELRARVARIEGVLKLE